MKTNLSKSNNEAEHLEGYFSSMYLTIIALAQGIAVALLAVPFIESISSGSFDWSKYAISLVVVLAIWHHYMIGSIFTRWFPDIRDSLLPIALVGSEIFMIETTINKIPATLWIHSIWVVAFIGCLAYANAGYRCDPILFSRLSLKDSERHCANIKITHGYYAATFCGVISLLTLCLAIFEKVPEWYSKLMLLLFICHIIVFEIIYSFLVKPFFR